MPSPRPLARLVPALLAALFTLAAQQPAHNPSLTEPDQELDDFTFRFVASHTISSQLRGVRGTGGTLYWISANFKQLTAYKHGRKLWQADVSRAFAPVLPGATIRKLVLSSGVLFIFTDRRGHAEVDRATGQVAAVGVDPK